MKKINSIGYGHKLLHGAIIFLIVVPSISCLLGKVANQLQLQSVTKASLILGVIIVLFLFVLLKVELYQDKKMDGYYRANSQSRLPLKNGLFECQACGNNRVKAGQKSCVVCGTNFINWSEDDGNKKHQ